jgi:Cof subfamily protein (haloacid dehalogenase superfamily)
MEIQEMGHIVAVASGRPLPGIRRIADELELEKYGGFVLAFNGGRIVDYRTKDVVYQACVDNDIAREIYDYVSSRDMGMVTYEGDTVITGTRFDDYMIMEAGLNFMELRSVENFKEYINFPINKCLLTAKPSLAEKVENELNARYSKYLTVFRSEPFFVEIMPKDVHKATSLEKLLKHLSMEVKDLIACGDGYNDLTMIEYAGVGVAMSNAQDTVKEHADYITGSNEDDGLVQVIDKFILNN